MKVLITDKLRKSQMGFRLVPKSITLNDLNGVIAFALRYFTEFGVKWPIYVKVVENSPTISATKSSPKYLVLAV